MSRLAAVCFFYGLGIGLAACPVTGQESGETPCPFSGVGAQPGPDPGQKTNMACTCKSSCAAGVSDAFNCDACDTEGSCGKRGLKGRYDYCEYTEDDTFESQTFQAKIDYFWTKIIGNPVRRSDYPNPLGIFKESIQTTFDNHKNEMPNGRVKMIHSIGSICQFKLDISETSPYTGLLSPGLQEGFIRMGSANAYSDAGITPGLGFKLPRTGRLSGDFVALHTLDPGQGWNFFAYNQSNHIPPPAGSAALKAIAKKFQQASQCAPQVGISDLARYSQNGTEHSPPKFPFKLFLVPSAAVQMDDSKKTVDMLHGIINGFPVGTTIYTVYACDQPTGDEMAPTDGGLEKACAGHIELGALVTTKRCTSSGYGDDKFHIRHQRIEEDWQMRPDDLQKYHASKACGWDGDVSAQGVPKKCSSQEAGEPINV